ncbi:prepilin-type N-terminal cleavage/methylation domain-containing protein [Parelusimicrobium proximum]|uniref:prepilin-type N-terminal cleavage/methylation domain-containing protein n=1 Tax=Parelusimicrobium proximum TaxID=3228953 RepID=UPI003D17D4C2
MGKKFKKISFCAAKGFTLIEISVVVVIIAVLAALAVPAYQKSVERSKNTEAVTILNKIKSEQSKRAAFNNGQYASKFSQLSPVIQGKKSDSDEIGTTNFTYSLKGSGANAYAEAVPTSKYKYVVRTDGYESGNLCADGKDAGIVSSLYKGCEEAAVNPCVASPCGAGCPEENSCACKPNQAVCCNSNQVWDDTKQQCVPAKQACVPCESNKVLVDDKNCICDCASGLTWDADSGKCITPKQECPEGGVEVDGVCKNPCNTNAHHHCYAGGFAPNPAGTYIENGDCCIPCAAAGGTLMPDGYCCMEESCMCGAGQELINGSCVPVCSAGQIRDMMSYECKTPCSSVSCAAGEEKDPSVTYSEDGSCCVSAQCSDEYSGWKVLTETDVAGFVSEGLKPCSIGQLDPVLYTQDDPVCDLMGASEGGSCVQMWQESSSTTEGTTITGESGASGALTDKSDTCNSDIYGKYTCTSADISAKKTCLDIYLKSSKAVDKGNTGMGFYCDGWGNISHSDGRCPISGTPLSGAENFCKALRMNIGCWAADIPACKSCPTCSFSGMARYYEVSCEYMARQVQCGKTTGSSSDMQFRKVKCCPKKG